MPVTIGFDTTFNSELDLIQQVRQQLRCSIADYFTNNLVVYTKQSNRSVICNICRVRFFVCQSDIPLIESFAIGSFEKYFVCYFSEIVSKYLPMSLIKLSS